MSGSTPPNCPAVEDEWLALPGDELDDVPDHEVVVAGGHRLVDIAVELRERLTDWMEPVRRSPYVVMREVAPTVGEVECHLALSSVQDRDREAPGAADRLERPRVVRERDEDEKRLERHRREAVERHSGGASVVLSSDDADTRREGADGFAEGVLDVDVGHDLGTHGAAYRTGMRLIP